MCAAPSAAGNWSVQEAPCLKHWLQRAGVQVYAKLANIPKARQWYRTALQTDALCYPAFQASRPAVPSDLALPVLRTCLGRAAVAARSCCILLLLQPGAALQPAAWALNPMPAAGWLTSTGWRCRSS